MVDKVDRPKPPESWTIKATAQSQDRGQENEQPFGDDEFSSGGERTDEWQKFHARAAPRRVIAINRMEIRHLWFLKAMLRRQSALVECDMEMTNGKLYKNAQFLLPRMDDYFQLKGYAIGQEIAATTFLHDPMVEVSIPTGIPHHARKPVVTPAIPQSVASPKWWQLWNPYTGEIQPLALLMYSLVMLGTLMGLVALI